MTSVVRRATADDYDAVINIVDDMWDGSDYMPTMYHVFLHSPRHVLYVAETPDNGRVVSSKIIPHIHDKSFMRLGLPVLTMRQQQTGIALPKFCNSFLSTLTDTKPEVLVPVTKRQTSKFKRQTWSLSSDIFPNHFGRNLPISSKVIKPPGSPEQ